jgi:uncharacterized iron-regulated membrane protein
MAVRPELVDVWLQAAKVRPPTRRRALPRPVVAVAAVIAMAVPMLAVLLALGVTLLASYGVTVRRENLD